MKTFLLSITLTFALSAPAFAGGAHSSGHEDDHAAMVEEMMAGMPGNPAKVKRTIDVTMREDEDGAMLFQPSSFEFAKGETIRFNIVNQGELEHEFVLDTKMGNAKHKEAMAKMEMEHDDPNSVRLDPGASGEVVWKFTKAGKFEFACLIPGHYESGMHGPITVSQNTAQAEVEYTTGKIKKIDAKSGKVTVIHGPLKNLDMPAMTMVFRADEALIATLSEGQEIKFAADRVKGKLTITHVK